MRTLVALLFAGSVAFGQAKDCSADGSVVNSVNAAPIPRARVTLMQTPGDSFTVMTDATGRWSMAHVACERVIITASRAGFLLSGQLTPGPRTVSLTAGTPLHDVKIELSPQAVLAGRIMDDQGDPVQGVQVSLMTVRLVNGVRGLQQGYPATTSNDLGEYRFAGLMAGKYIICLTPTSAATPYAEKCYPGPADAGAAIAMDVSAGYEGRVDFTLTPLATHHVRGVVSGGPEEGRRMVSLVPASGRMQMGLSARVGTDGNFDVTNVVPGAYTLTAATGQPNGRFTARVPVQVGSGDVDGIQLHLAPGLTVTGTVKVISAVGRKIEKPQYTALLRSSDPSLGATQGNWDESKMIFTMTDVVPSSYRFEFSAPAPFYVKSATMGGRDITSSEVTIADGAGTIEVVLSDDGGAVEGDVSSDDGSVAAWILLARDGGSPRNSRTDAKGHFKIDTIPPGDYKVYAWDDNSKVEYANPEWMRRHAKGVAVTVLPGQTAAVNLTRQVAAE